MIQILQQLSPWAFVASLAVLAFVIIFALSILRGFARIVIEARRDDRIRQAYDRGFTEGMKRGADMIQQIAANVENDERGDGSGIPGLAQLLRVASGEEPDEVERSSDYETSSQSPTIASDKQSN